MVPAKYSFVQIIDIICAMGIFDKKSGRSLRPFPGTSVKNDIPVAGQLGHPGGKLSKRDKC